MILSKQVLINNLLSITFTCVDVVDENHGDYVFVLMVKHSPEETQKFLEKHMSRWPSSLNTSRAFAQFKDSKNWDSFHATAHFMMIDKIVHFLNTGEGRVNEAINQSLKCGTVSEEVLKSLYHYVNHSKAQQAA